MQYVLRWLCATLFVVTVYAVPAATPAAAQVADCNCSRPQRPAVVCRTACMTHAEWAACATKSWWADSKDRRFRTPRFFTRCGTVCRPAGSPRLGYLTSGGRWIVFRF